jgi:hypothetical protein
MRETPARRFSSAAARLLGCAGRAVSALKSMAGTVAEGLDEREKALSCMGRIYSPAAAAPALA